LRLRQRLTNHRREFLHTGAIDLAEIDRLCVGADEPGDCCGKQVKVGYGSPDREFWQRLRGCRDRRAKAPVTSCRRGDRLKRPPNRGGATQEQRGSTAAARTISGIGCPGIQVSTGLLPRAKLTHSTSVVGCSA